VHEFVAELEATIHPPDFGPGEELDAFRRWDAGLPISEEHAQHLAGLTPRELEMLREMAKLHDEQDKRVRAEIAKYPEGYGWHKTVGGGLPFDWTDSELPRLRPQDWRQAREVRFVRVASPRTAKQRVRPVTRSREHRPGTTRRTASSSTTSGQDPSDPEPPRRRQLRHISFALTAFLRTIGVAR
jgi:hypothetical protein